jgi:hypothetical protein
VKRDGDFTHEIWFQLDRNNYAGGRVAAWAHAGIGSRKLQRRRTQNGTAWGILPSYPPDFDGGQIGNLRLPRAWMVWNFADPTSRDATVRDLIDAIRQIVFPFFAKYRDPDAVMRIFEQGDLLGPTSAIEYVQAHFGRDGANRVLKSILAKEPRLVEPFLDAVALYQREGLPPGLNGEMPCHLAAMAVFLALDPTGF